MCNGLPKSVVVSVNILHVHSEALTTYKESSKEAL